MFWGLLANIPAGWKSCDGTLGTPDLRDKFILGAGYILTPCDSGGSVNHTHTFTSDTHFHEQLLGTPARAGPGYDATSNAQVLTGTTNNATMIPPYFALIFVQKI